MTDISDIVEMVVSAQAGVSFLAGLTVGIISRATGLKMKHLTLGGGVAGYIISSVYGGTGYTPLVIDVGAATFGTVVGARLVDRAARIMYDR